MSSVTLTVQLLNAVSVRTAAQRASGVIGFTPYPHVRFESGEIEHGDEGFLPRSIRPVPADGRLLLEDTLRTALKVIQDDVERAGAELAACGYDPGRSRLVVESLCMRVTADLLDGIPSKPQTVEIVANLLGRSLLRQPVRTWVHADIVGVYISRSEAALRAIPSPPTLSNVPHRLVHSVYISGCGCARERVAHRAPLAMVREALRASVEASSLRRVANEVGLPASGVRNIIEGGAKPHRATLKKLDAWLLTYEANRERVSADAVRPALGLLVGGLSTRRASAPRRRLLDVVRAAHKDAGAPLPPWLDDVGDE